MTAAKTSSRRGASRSARRRRVAVPPGQRPLLDDKPTYGDVVPAERADDGNWEWNRRGASGSRIGERLHSDGGRYALIVDYTMRTDADFGALVQALERKHDIVGEGCFGPRGEEPGRLYLAAQRALDPATVMAAVTTLGRGFRFVLVHPVPAKPRAKKATKKKKSAAAVKKPAKAKKSKSARRRSQRRSWRRQRSRRRGEAAHRPVDDRLRQGLGVDPVEQRAHFVRRPAANDTSGVAVLDAHDL